MIIQFRKVLKPFTYTTTNNNNNTNNKPFFRLVQSETRRTVAFFMKVVHMNFVTIAGCSNFPTMLWNSRTLASIARKRCLQDLSVVDGMG